MSFIDLMGNVVYTDAQILRRTEAHIRNVFSRTAEEILNRKITEIGLGQGQMTPELGAEIALFAKVAKEAQEMGEQAKKDNTLLKSILKYENASRRLLEPLYEGEEFSVGEDGQKVENVEYTKDRKEREEAESIIKNTSEEVVALVSTRKPQEVQDEEVISEFPAVVEQ
jgi:hypothetical protein